jgi:3-hydroxyisobutyrate dehydrogenase-like beta-hydroxyacid dehydrogenase
MEGTMEKIGFIGVGSIGAPMARCVIRAGFKVTVYARSAPSRAAFADIAAQVTDKPSDCAGQDMVIVIVANDEQVEQVILGSDGLLSAIDPQRPPLLAIMSTVLPQTVEAVAAACAPKGVKLVDAPVSGGPVVAEQGKLTIMVGGELADLEQMRPVLASMGEHIFHTGALGTGQVTKLVNNILGVTNLFLCVEAMRVGKAYGMDLQRLAAILETGSGRNFSTKDWDRSKAFFGYFAKSLELCKSGMDVARKDLHHARELAKKAGLDMPFLDHILDAVNQFSPEEMQERWGSVTS